MTEKEYINFLIKMLNESADESGVWDYPTYYITAKAVAASKGIVYTREKADMALDLYLEGIRYVPNTPIKKLSRYLNFAYLD